MKYTEHLRYGINENENILWVGKPKLIACFLESIAYGWPFILTGILFTKDKAEWIRIVSFICILLGIFVSFLQFLSRAKTVYMITDKRIISNVFWGIGVKKYIAHNEVLKIKTGQNMLNAVLGTKNIGFFVGERGNVGDVLDDVYQIWNYLENVEEATIILNKIIPDIAITDKGVH